MRVTIIFKARLQPYSLENSVGANFFLEDTHKSLEWP